MNKLVAGIATAVASLALLGGATAASASTTPASASTITSNPKAPVALNYWRGSRIQPTYIRTVRPRVLGGQFGEPITSIHWTSWGQHSARGRGLYVFMTCQPCHVTLYLHDARWYAPSGSSYNFRYYEKLRETFRGTGAGYLHWSWTKDDWI